MLYPMKNYDDFCSELKVALGIASTSTRVDYVRYTNSACFAIAGFWNGRTFSLEVQAICRPGGNLSDFSISIDGVRVSHYRSQGESEEIALLDRVYELLPLSRTFADKRGDVSLVDLWSEIVKGYDDF